ncbi:GntR family transcriptional regulator [Geminicoccus roseus]|uniref:GntR family transcriptional regulator n=1 Tax=Geminicoccus roseus TaxID=404900 RepID=UPI000A06FC8A|nr:GntR family transcriptional regulator [Geminicoccus roseus]
MAREVGKELGRSLRRSGELLQRVDRPRSLVAIVLDQIRDLIVTDGLHLGEQISENTLAERLGVSRTPVREALLRLASERLVEIQPQRGTFVFQCGADEVRDICQLREILEVGALGLAVARDREGLLAALDPSLEAAAKADLRSSADYQPYDHAFHELLVASSGNAELIEAYGKISGRIRAIRHRIIRTLDQVAESQAAHRTVVEHVRAGDDALAEQALRHHVYSSYRGARALAGGSDD